MAWYRRTKDLVAIFYQNSGGEESGKTFPPGKKIKGNNFFHNLIEMNMKQRENQKISILKAKIYIFIKA